MYTFPEHVHTYAFPKNMCAFPKDTGVCMSSGKAHKQMYAFPQKYTLFIKTHLYAFPENIFYRTASWSFVFAHHPSDILHARVSE